MARKILLADDSVTAQNMGRKILADAGYEVITVNNGSAALKKISEQRPDLIVLDVYMPGYSGLEVCQRLKEANETANIPVLLTVGKLEPFKPEEAKRVRAESFIVKPFEASELLSVLSKLEDRIVPRSGPAKSGRFARAIAEVEQSSRSQKDQSGEERSGWKKRISFPSKKQAATSDEDDSAIYNAMNRDLRTVVNHEKAPQETVAKSAAPEGSLVDMSAIAAPGAPGDVSPEEIAAIAAAAAQVQAAKDPSTSSWEEKPLITEERPADIPNLEQKLQTNEKEEANPIEARPGTEHEDKGQSQAAPSRTNAELIAAIAALEPANGGTWAGSGNGAGPSSKEQADVPATMASTGETSSSDSRWVAIPVAMAADEAAISLELEMQKAYAAFAAAEANHPGFVTSAPALETSSPETSSPELSSITDSSAQVEHPAASHQEPELTNTANAVASASAEAVSAAAEKLAAVAESYVQAECAPPQSTAAPVQADAKAVAETASIQEEVSPHQEPPHAPPVQNVEEPIAAEPVPASEASMNQDEPQSMAQPASVVAEATAVSSESPAGGTGIMAENKESDTTANTAAAWASWRQVRDSGDSRSVEPSKAHKHEDEDDDAPAPSSELAAMAVAAGAEKSPLEAEASDADPAAIASIVDSVLADLRPKIVEEISKKLGKKK